MKVKLYRKYVKLCLKCFKKVSHKTLFGPKKFEEFLAHPLKYDEDGKKVLDGDSIQVINANNFLHVMWKEFLLKDAFEKKYKRYSRKWWAPEAVAMRAIKGEKD